MVGVLKEVVKVFPQDQVQRTVEQIVEIPAGGGLHGPEQIHPHFLTVRRRVFNECFRTFPHFQKCAVRRESESEGAGAHGLRRLMSQGSLRPMRRRRTPTSGWVRLQVDEVDCIPWELEVARHRQGRGHLLDNMGHALSEKVSNSQSLHV